MNDSVDLTSLKKELHQLLELKKIGQVRRRLAKALYREGRTIEDVAEIIVELILKEPELMWKKVANWLDYSKANESVYEKLFTNHCLYEGEKLIAKFNGDLSYQKSAIRGNIYLTNYRIWTGRRFRTSFSHPLTLIGGLITLGSYAVRKPVADTIVNTVRGSPNVPEWGYSFPLFNAKDIKKTKKEISYKITVSIENNQKNIKVNVKPRIKGAKETIVTQIEKLLLDNQ